MTTSDKNTRFVVAALVALVIGALAVFAYASRGRSADDRVADLWKVLYVECQQRTKYDVASQEARRVAQEYWSNYIQAEQLNTFIDDKLRAQRVRNAQLMVDSLGVALKTTPNVSCERYQPR